MQHYLFHTIVVLRGPKKALWHAVIDYSSWPLWWKGVETVREEKPVHGNPKLLCVIGPRLYRLKCYLTPEHVDMPKEIHLRTEGDLVGYGTFLFTEKGENTQISFTWNVKTTKLWMNLVAPIAKSFFRSEHEKVMDQFAKGLATRVQGKLISVTHQ